MYAVHAESVASYDVVDDILSFRQTEASPHQVTIISLNLLHVSCVLYP